MALLLILKSSLPPATKLGQGNIFTGVCDSVHRGGPASVHAGIPPPTPPPPEQSILGDTVNEREVCIVLEYKLHKKSQPTHADLLQLNKILLQATRFKTMWLFLPHTSFG